MVSPYLENNQLIIHTRLIYHRLVTYYKFTSPKHPHNVTTTFTIQGNRVKSTNNPLGGSTQTSHSVRYLYNMRSPFPSCFLFSLSPALQGDFPDYIPTAEIEETYGNFFVRIDEERNENNYTCRKLLLRNDEIQVCYTFFLQSGPVELVACGSVV